MKNIKKRFERFKNNKGFTLIEFVVVIAIMAILSLVSVPAFTGYTTKANEAKDLQNARLGYTHLIGEYPEVITEYELKGILGLKDSDVLTINGDVESVTVNSQTYPTKVDSDETTPPIENPDENEDLGINEDGHLDEFFYLNTEISGKSNNSNYPHDGYKYSGLDVSGNKINDVVGTFSINFNSLANLEGDTLFIPKTIHGNIVRNYTELFKNADELINSYGVSKIKFEDSSNVTHVQDMIHHSWDYRGEDGYLKFENFDFSGVVDATSMMNNVFFFNDLGIEKWNTDSLVIADYMFNGTIDIKADLKGWNVSNVISADNMLTAPIGTGSDLSGWDWKSLSSDSNLRITANLQSRDVPININNWTIPSGVEIPSIQVEGFSDGTVNANNWTIKGNTMENPARPIVSFYNNNKVNLNMKEWKVTNVPRLMLFDSNQGDLNIDISVWNINGGANSRSIDIDIHNPYGVPGVGGGDVEINMSNWTLTDIDSHNVTHSEVKLLNRDEWTFK